MDNEKKGGYYYEYMQVMDAVWIDACGVVVHMNMVI
jgi:hypothetical protein